MRLPLEQLFFLYELSPCHQLSPCNRSALGSGRQPLPWQAGGTIVVRCSVDRNISEHELPWHLLNPGGLN